MVTYLRAHNIRQLPKRSERYLAANRRKKPISKAGLQFSALLSLYKEKVSTISGSSSLVMASSANSTHVQVADANHASSGLVSSHTVAISSEERPDFSFRKAHS